MSPGAGGEGQARGSGRPQAQGHVRGRVSPTGSPEGTFTKKPTTRAQKLEERAHQLAGQVKAMEKELGGIHEAFSNFSDETRRNLAMLTGLVDQLVAAQEVAAAQRRGKPRSQVAQQEP